MCPGTELNRYDRCGSQDFKSCVSTNSTTGAIICNGRPTILKIRFQRYAFSMLKKNPAFCGIFLERKTGLEPATSTLARSRSTKWATFACVIFKSFFCFGSAKIAILAILQNFYAIFFICTLVCTRCCSALLHPVCPYNAFGKAYNLRQPKKPLLIIPVGKIKTGCCLPSYNQILFYPLCLRFRIFQLRVP